MKTPSSSLLPDMPIHIKGQHIVTRIGKDIVGPVRFIEQKEYPDDHISKAKDIDYDSGSVGRRSSMRTIGLPIRPVINPRETGIDDIEYKQTIRMAYHNGSIELSSIANCDHIDILNIYGQKVLSSSVTAKNIDVPQIFKRHIYLHFDKEGQINLYTENNH